MVCLIPLTAFAAEMNNKTYKVAGRVGLGTKGKIRRKNKRRAAKKIRNGKVENEM